MSLLYTGAQRRKCPSSCPPEFLLLLGKPIPGLARRPFPLRHPLPGQRGPRPDPLPAGLAQRAAGLPLQDGPFLLPEIQGARGRAASLESRAASHDVEGFKLGKSRPAHGSNLDDLLTKLDTRGALINTPFTRLAPGFRRSVAKKIQDFFGDPVGAGRDGRNNGYTQRAAEGVEQDGYPSGGASPLPPRPFLRRLRRAGVRQAFRSNLHQWPGRGSIPFLIIGRKREVTHG